MPLSRGNRQPKRAYFNSNHPKRDGRGDCVSLKTPKIKVNAVESKRRTSKFLDTNSYQNSAGCSEEENITFSVVRLPEKVPRCSKYSESMKPRKQNEGKDQKQSQKFDSVDTMKAHMSPHRLEDRTMDKISFRKDSTFCASKKKPDGVKISSENTKSDAVSVVDYPTLRASVGQIQETEKAGKGKPTNNMPERNDFIAARKRQREDVEALLPSAFISSKKREKIFKSEPSKRPFSGYSGDDLQ